MINPMKNRIVLGVLAATWAACEMAASPALADSSPFEGAICPREEVDVGREPPRSEAFDPETGRGAGLRAPTTGLVPEDDLQTGRWVGIPVIRNSAWQSVLVGADAVGLVLYATVRDPGFAVSVEVEGPGGEQLSCPWCEDAPVVGEEKRGRGSAQIPSTDRPGSALVPGTYRFRVHARQIPSSHVIPDPAETVADVFAAIRSNAAPVVERVLDLNFVYLPGLPLNEDVATSTPEFAELLALTNARLGPLGIRIGEVTHVDLDRPEYTHLESWSEAGQLFASTSKEVGRNRTLNVYCVGIFEGDFLNVAGLSGGIPGAAENGTRDSGIALRIAPSYPNFLEAYAGLFAHEIGHYLGFYHTTEGNLERADPLSDTPRCDEPDLHACPDWPYYMFPIVNGAMNTWSPSQVAIAQTHPYVRTAPVGTRMRAASAHPFDAAPLRARPNPFTDDVVFELPASAAPSAVLEIFDVSGRRVRTLSFRATAGVWNGLDDEGRRTPPGFYFARVGGAGASASFVTRIVRTR